MLYNSVYNSYLYPSLHSAAIFVTLYVLFTHLKTTKKHVTFEVFTVVTMKNVVHLEVTLCGSCKNQQFGGIFCLLHQSGKNQRARNNVSSKQ
jgi:hypothetical protein